MIDTERELGVASRCQGEGSQSLAGLGELAIRHVLAHFSCTSGEN